jgi:hypothetical protein
LALKIRELKRIRKIIISILTNLPSEIFIKQTERPCYGLTDVIFSYKGVFVSNEVHLSIGRADVIGKTINDVLFFNLSLIKWVRRQFR